MGSILLPGFHQTSGFLQFEGIILKSKLLTFYFSVIVGIEDKMYTSGVNMTEKTLERKLIRSVVVSSSCK